MSKITVREGVKIRISRNKTTMSIYENSPVLVYGKSKKLTSSSKCKKKADSSKQKKKKNQFSSEPSLYAEINYVRRQQKRIRTVKEICNNNFRKGSVIVNLTFDPLLFIGKDLHDIEITHAEFKKFIKRINDHYENFMYIATFSKQENGDWHYHMICNLDSCTSESDIKEIWQNGNIVKDTMYTNDYFMNEVNYLIENMKAASEDLKGKKGYLCSKNVERDIVIDSENPEQEELYNQILEKIENHIQDGMKNNENTIHSIGTNEVCLGVAKECIDKITGEVYIDLLFNQELTKHLEKAGYIEFKYKSEVYYLYITFNEKFSTYKTATLRKKKFKRKK